MSIERDFCVDLNNSTHNIHIIINNIRALFLHFLLCFISINFLICKRKFNEFKENKFKSLLCNMEFYPFGGAPALGSK